VVGMPVLCATELLNPEIPRSLFQEKEKPNMPLKPNINKAQIVFLFNIKSREAVHVTPRLSIHCNSNPVVIV
jgi:hypothetical protein